MSENKVIPSNNTSTKEVDLTYLKSAISTEELIEELNLYTKDLKNAGFTTTFGDEGLVKGVTDGYEATMKVIEDIINRCEEEGQSPDPMHDQFITALYNVYNALDKLKDKCKYL